MPGLGRCDTRRLHLPPRRVMIREVRTGLTVREGGSRAASRSRSRWRKSCVATRLVASNAAPGQCKARRGSIPAVFDPCKKWLNAGSFGMQRQPNAAGPSPRAADGDGPGPGGVAHATARRRAGGGADDVGRRVDAASNAGRKAGSARRLAQQERHPAGTPACPGRASASEGRRGRRAASTSGPDLQEWEKCLRGGRRRAGTNTERGQYRRRKTNLSPKGRLPGLPRLGG